jgi:hypothetical protein
MSVSTPNIFYINDIIYKINEYIKDDNNLLNCNKYLNELKLKNYKLNIEYSLKYCNNIHFRNLIHSKIINSRLQLSLNLTQTTIDEGLKNLGNLHTLNLWGCKRITDEGLKHLGHLHTLNLSNCDKITDEGVKYLGNLHTLYLQRCNQITDKGLKNLSDLHTLDLSCCSNITDEGIKYLGNLHMLNLKNCNKITDEGIKYLENVKNLIR